MTDNFSYPIYKKSKRDELVIKFTSLKEGKVVVGNNYWNTSHLYYDWIPHTDTEVWEDWAPPQPNNTKEELMEYSKDAQFEYPIYKKLKNKTLVVKFTSLEEGEVVVASTDWAVGYVADDWTAHTDNSIWEDWTPPLETTKDISALDTQEGGNHYKDLKIQPVEFIDANGLDYFQGNVVKYVTRHKLKNGAEDVKKAIHYCQLILQMQYGE